jgi:hypothetical protein
LTLLFIWDSVRAGHFRYKYRYFDIRYLSDTEKSIEIPDLKSKGISNIVLQIFTSDTPILYRKGEKVSDQKSIDDEENCLKTGLKRKCVFSFSRKCENLAKIDWFLRNVTKFRFTKVVRFSKNFLKNVVNFLQNFSQKRIMTIFEKNLWKWVFFSRNFRDMQAGSGWKQCCRSSQFFSGSKKLNPSWNISICTKKKIELVEKWLAVGWFFVRLITQTVQYSYIKYCASLYFLVYRKIWQSVLLTVHLELCIGIG